MARHGTRPAAGALHFWRAERREEYAAWWTRFSSESLWTELEPRERALLGFVGFAAREYLFCASAAPRRCAAVSVEQVQTYLLKTAPDVLVVDDPDAFGETTVVWLRWLVTRGMLEHGKAIARTLARGAWRREARDALRAAAGGASKRLMLQARDAGVDLANADAVLSFVCGLRPGDASWREYCGDLLDPPYPAFHRGQALYTYGWPPMNPGEG